MTEQNDPLPRPADELEALATYYDTHDTSAELDQGEWVNTTNSPGSASA